MDGTNKTQLYYQDTTGFGSAFAANPTSATPFKFGGGNGCQTDGDYGLVLMGHRYYDTRIGRFLSQDPKGEGTNWYAYAGNNPANGIDPLGLVCPKFDSTGMSFSQIYDYVLANGGMSGESYKTIQGGKVIFSFMVSSTDFTHVVPGFNVTTNFNAARQYANTPLLQQGSFGFGSMPHFTMALPTMEQKLIWFADRVRPGSHGDPKHILKDMGNNPLYPYYDRIGQYNFGAVAAGLRLDLDLSQVGAGVAQTGMSIIRKTFLENLRQNGWVGSGSPYGDDPASQYWIMRGYNDYLHR